MPTAAGRHTKREMSRPTSIFGQAAAAAAAGDTATCEVCSAKTRELRRGRCWGCYARWAESKPVGAGAACVICNERRRANLKQVELLGSWLPMCHNCAARTTALMPMPQTLDEIRARLARDRRTDERRTGKADTRIFKRDRRGLERRAVGHVRPGDDPLLLGDDEILIVIEEEEGVGGDETRVLPAHISAGAATLPVK